MFDHVDRYFTLATAGLGLVLVGGVNLALGGAGRRVWVRLVLGLGLSGAVCLGLGAITRTELALQAATVQGGVLAVAVLLGSATAARRTAALAAHVRKPGLRWSLVAVGGLGAVLASGLAFDRDEERASDEAMLNLELAVGRVPTKPTLQTRAATDAGTPIVLKEPVEHRDDISFAGPEARLLRDSPFHDQLIRRSGASGQSNCHGWVFTGGRFLLSPEDVETIVRENGYHETATPLPGDLVVYRQQGCIAHTAVVRYVSEGQPVLVEGKWGALGVFLHPADKSHYGIEYTFHRSARTGHVLAGLNGSPLPVPATDVTE